MTTNRRRHGVANVLGAGIEVTDKVQRRTPTGPRSNGGRAATSVRRIVKATTARQGLPERLEEALAIRRVCVFVDIVETPATATTTKPRARSAAA